MTVNKNSKGIQIFTQEEALEKSTEYFKGNTLAAEVFVTKYALKNENLEYVEATPDQMHKRIAKEFARVEKKFPNPIPEEEIFKLLDQFKYLIPGGSPMFGIGNPYQKISLSNCFVIKTVDSYGGICKADERIAQICKRRGGCVEENSNVYIKGRGLVKIKEVNIGDKVLSYNKENRESEFKKVLDKYYTDVKKQNQIKIKLSNGYILRTSVTHPVMVFDGEHYIYKKAGLLKKGDICVVPESESVKFNSSTISKRMEEIGWFIGAHTGDGTLGFIKDYQQEKYERVYKGNKRLRIRILGNNEEVVKKYTNICNSLVGSNSKYSRSTRKGYKSICWQYTNNSGKLFKVAQKYFDNKVGRKTYDCPVFSFVRDNNLWMPYIAGLIDTDGHIRSDNGHIDIAICAKQVIDEVSSFLSAYGFKIHVATRKPRRKNEKQLYRLMINDQEFSKIIIQYLCHDKKIQQLKKHLDNRCCSRTFSFSNQEKEDVLSNYKRIKYTANQNLTLKERANRSAIVSLLKKRSELGQGGIVTLRDFKLISENKSKEIMQRYRIVGLEKEKEDLKYIDIEVGDNNNYYAGNYGLINIHNCGLDISPIRPRGVATRNSAFTTDGITVFMERFSNTSREVAQSGRRGALMLTISVHHPEIINFINIKRDLKKVTGANISVRVSDEFMEAVKKDKKYELRWPIDSSEPKISSKIRARDVWDELVRSNYLSGEPGILFWDNIIRNSPADCYSDLGFETLATNPCITGETLVYVADGRGNIPIKTLADQGDDVPVFCYDDKGKVSVRTMRHPRITGYKQPIYKVTLDDGNIIRATANHKIRLTDGNYKRVDELEKGDGLKILTKFEASIKDIFPNHTSKSQNYLWLNNGLRANLAEHRIIASHFNGDIQKGEVVHHRDYNGENNSPDNLLIINKKDHDIDVDPRLVKTLRSMIEQGYNSFIDGNKVFVEKVCEECGKKFIKEHLQREISFCSVSCSNCCNNNNKLVNKKRTQSINKTYQEKAGKNKQEQLKVFTGLKFEMDRSPMRREWEKSCGENNIPFRLKTKHGFQNYNELKESAETFNHRVVSVEIDGYEDVYNGTVDDFHNFFIGGFEGKTKSDSCKWLYINNLNCGELPICEAGSCILMAMNLSSYVDDPFTDKAKFNQSKFKKHVRMCQKLMDDLVELEIEAIRGIIQKVESDPEDSETKANELSLWKLVLDKCERGRRTGLGITALGDFIAMLNVKYGSDESLEIVNNVYSILRNEAYKSSIEMSKERGSFPIFDYTKERGNEYLGRLPANIRADMNKHGRRNIGCLTTAPVGSGSTVSKILDLFGTTSGFEPAFKLEYKRKRKLGDTDKDKPDFVDEMGDKWKEYIITHSGVEMFKKISGKPVEESPYFGAQAEDIEYSKRVKMQAIATQYVDHAISSTINLSSEIDIDTVSNIYLSAWGSGCKGLTIYRSGTRDGVLVDVNNTRECQDCDEASKNLVSLIEGGRRPVNIIQASAPKRPEILECDIHRSKVGGKDWIFFVGKLDGHPYEVFGGDSQEFTIPHKYKSGWICKNGKIEGVTQYNLILGSVEDQNEKLEFKGIAKHFNNYEYGEFTRLTSLTMRHGAPIKYICEQITKKGVEGDLFSFQRALARILKKYISEGEKSKDGMSNVSF